jgi:hypothetical protein
MGTKKRRLRRFKVHVIHSNALLTYQLLCTSKDHAVQVTQEMLPAAKILSVYQEREWQHK